MLIINFMCINKLKIIFFGLFFIAYSAQNKYYTLSLVDGSKMITMRQSNQLVQESNRLLANLVIKDKKSEKIFYLGSVIASSLVLQI